MRGRGGGYSVLLYNTPHMVQCVKTPTKSNAIFKIWQQDGMHQCVVISSVEVGFHGAHILKRSTPVLVSPRRVTFNKSTGCLP